VHKQLPQIAVASLADAEKSGLAAGRVLARHKSQPGGELPALVEGRSVADRSDDPPIELDDAAPGSIQPVVKMSDAGERYLSPVRSDTAENHILGDAGFQTS
jgi:hypothetical protein